MKQQETENNTSTAPKVWFVADLHFCHKNILKHQPHRIKGMGLEGKDEDELIRMHDKYIVDTWLSQTKRGDIVYVLGDFIMSSQEVSLRILHHLKSKGCKIHLIVGNHDKSTQKMFNMFESIQHIKIVDFKKSVFPFLDSDFTCVLCHYPMVSWPRKCHGAMHLYGHIHDNAPWMNDTRELTLNVGIDCPHMHYKLISLEEVYATYKAKLGTMKPKDYVDMLSSTIENFVR